MPSAAPLFSIVIACRNPGPKLAHALESVWSQRKAALEIIVIDGASTDGTPEWLRAHQARLDFFASEPDRGVYDAMNRGIPPARGDWILFLGADDYLVDEEVLHAVALNLAKTEAAVVVGEVAYDDGRIYRLPTRPQPVARNFVHHQGAFYRRAVFSEHGAYDPSLAVMADYDLNLRLWKAGARFRALPVRIAVCGAGGLSDAGAWRGYGEEITVRHRYFAPWQCWTWDAASLARYARKRTIRSLSPF